MAMQIFVNLAVKDLQRTIAFFERLGFGFDARFTDDNATCMVVSDGIYVMLLVEPFFQTFTPRPVADARAITEVLMCLGVESRARVDELVAAAVAGGGRTLKPAKDHGFMYEHGFEDLDGHLWELVYMEPEGESAAPAA